MNTDGDIILVKIAKKLCSYPPPDTYRGFSAFESSYPFFKQPTWKFDFICDMDRGCDNFPDYEFVEIKGTLTQIFKKSQIKNYSFKQFSEFVRSLKREKHNNNPIASYESKISRKKNKRFQCEHYGRLLINCSYIDKVIGKEPIWQNNPKILR